MCQGSEITSIQRFIGKRFYLRVVNFKPYSFSMWRSVFTDVILSIPPTLLCNLFKYSATCRGGSMLSGD